MLRRYRDRLERIAGQESDPDMKVSTEYLEQGKPEHVIALLKYTRRLPTSRDKHGSSLLHLAALYGYVELAEALLSYGTDINVRDGYGQPALHWATTPEMIRFFLNRGIDVDERDKCEWTPLYALAREGRI